MPIAQTTNRSSPFIKGRWVALFLISFTLGMGTAQASPIGDLVDIDYSASGTTTGSSGFSFVLDPLDLDQVLVSDMMAEVENHVLGADSIIRINAAVNLTVDVKEDTVTASFQNISEFNALLSGSFSVSDLDWLNNGIPVAGQITGASIDRMDVMLNWGTDFVGFDFSNLTINHGDSFQATISFTTGHSSSPPPIPEPSTMLLFGSGLAGLAAWRYRKSKNA